jgi:glycosyltransferase involved in cell wall biosynthesis
VVRGLSEKDSRIKLFCLDRNTKFGGAFAECFKRATGDIIMYLDSDMPVTIEDIKQSIALIEKADIINGCSKVKKGDSAKRKFISWAYNLMVRTLFGLKVKDINSGFKIVRRELVKDIEFLSSSPFIDVELFLHARKKNARVEQYPLIFQTRTGGVSHIARIPIIMATFWDMIKVRLLR